MQKLTLLLSIFFIGFISSCAREGLKKYYTKISQDEFTSFDSTHVVARSKYGIIYRAYTHVQAKSGDTKLDFLVFEKHADGNTSDLFKLDVDGEIKNDSTFIFYGAPLEVSGDTINWVKGKWFYQKTNGGESVFKVDSMPANLPSIEYQRLPMGVYQYENHKLIKICNTQSEEAFWPLNLNGFFYLPNPGRFYILANFNQIE